MPLRRPVSVLTLSALSAGLLAAFPVAPALAVSPDVVISQVYGGGGNSGAPLRSDFVELFNTGTTPVDITGWTVQYASAAGAFDPSSTTLTTTLSGTIAPGGFYLVKQADGANASATALPTPDATGSTAMSGTGAKVRLATTAGDIRDLVAYGNGLPAEGTATPALSNTTAALRNPTCTDTDNNSDDFDVAAPAPRNSATAPAPCTVTPPPDDAPIAITNPSPVTAQVGTPQTFTVSATDTDDVITAASFTGTPGSGVTVTGGAPGGNTVTYTISVAADAAAGVTDLVFSFTTADDTETSPFQLTVTDPNALTPISAVQGAAATSPLVGQTVTVEGVVVGDYQGADQFGGFYVQSVTPDSDPLTSEGVRVFNSATPVAVGDLVRVRGAVSEFTSSSNLYTGSETQFPASSTVTVVGTAPVPDPTPITLPFAATTGGVQGQERFEGMLATIVNDDLVATDLFTLGRFGEVSLTTGELLYIPTTAEEDAANNADRVTLDDALSGQNLPALPYTIGGDGVTLPRAGDAPTDAVTGVFSYAFGEWRINPPVGTAIDFERLNPREPRPEPVGGDVQVASFNVLNYFTSFGGDNRGANDADELVRQEAKLVSAITGLDADVVGLIEIANDDGDALDTLVAALNAAQPDAVDDYVAVEAPALTPANSLGGTYGTDAIRQAIIYRPSVVTPAGPPPSDAALLNPADAPPFQADPVFDRPPAVQDFVPVGGDREFTVFVNHFKSKGSTNAQCGTPDQFGGNCDDLRERQSAALVDLVDALNVTDAALLGDFNAYEEEQPIAILEAAGYTSVVADQPREDRASYSFDGEFGSLDYIFLSEGLAPAQTGADIWQINSPEAVAYDYNNFNQAALYAPDAFASSDHDPLLVGLDLVPLDATGDFTLTLLQSNDGESALLPAAPRGGIARFGTLLNELRAQAAAEESTSLVLSGGDNFLAGPQLQASLENFSNDGDYANDGPFYDAVALDYLDYDASSVGNHEFDFGPEVFGYFLSQFTDSNIRFVSANLDVTGEDALAEFVQPSPGTTGGALVEWTRTVKDGRPIAIVGVTTPELASVSSPGPDVVVDPEVVTAIQEAIDAATADGTNIVVLVSQLQTLTVDAAVVEDLEGVDIVVSGGGGEILANADDVLLPGSAAPSGAYPLLRTSADGAAVPVVTTQGLYGYVGRLILDVDATGAVTTVSDRSGPVRNVFNATTPPADQKTPDAFLLENVEAPVQAFLGDLQTTVVGTTEVVLNGTQNDVRARETNLGSLFADALRVTAATEAPEFGATNPTVGLQNSGGIRNSVVLQPGTFSRNDVFRIAPFANFVGYALDVSPAKLKELLERSVSSSVGANGQLIAQGRFGQLSGLEIEYDPSRLGQRVVRNPDGTVTVTVAGERVRSVVLTNNTDTPADDVVLVQDGVVVGTQAVDLASNSFTIGQNGDDYPFNLTPEQFTNLPTTYQESLESYLAGLSPITAAEAPVGGFGRIVSAIAPEAIAVAPDTEVSTVWTASPDQAPVDDRSYTATGLVPGEQYRITLVRESQVTFGGPNGTVFAQDGTTGLVATGAPSADITQVNGAAPINNTGDGTPTITGTPVTASAVGIADSTGTITFVIDGDGTESVLPVVYRNGLASGPASAVTDNPPANGGVSPRLEINANGVPTEPFDTGGVTNFAAETPDVLAVTPDTLLTVEAVAGIESPNRTVDDRTYSVAGLVAGQEYRVTVLQASTVTGDGPTAVFTDDVPAGGDDLTEVGTRQAVLTSVNGAAPTNNTGDGTPLTAAPNTQTAVFVAGANGTATFVLEGVANGESVRPVVYRNGGPANTDADGGQSPRLELNADGTAAEPFDLGGVTTFAVEPRDVIVVTPDNTVTLEAAPGVESPNVATDDRTYSVSGLVAGQEYRVTVLEASTVTGNGPTAVFTDNVPPIGGDLLTDVGTRSAVLTSVNGAAPTNNTGDGTPLTAAPNTQTAVFVAGANGTATFVLEGVSPESVRPVVYRNGGPGNTAADGGQSPRLELNPDLTAAEPFDLGGVTTFVAAPEPEPTFSDVDADSVFFEDIEFLVDAGITQGFEDGTFGPGLPVLRNQMAAFLYRLAGEPAFTPPATATFPDVPVGADLRLEIEWLADQEITLGVPQADGTSLFLPGGEVSRGQMAAFLYRLAGEPAFTAPATPTFADTPATALFFREIEWLADQGISLGFPVGDTFEFRAGQSVTRGEMAAFLRRYSDNVG